MFDTKKFLQIPKSKTDEISLSFSGVVGGPKMANLDFRGKMPKMAKITIFRKFRQVEVSATDMWLGIYSREVLIFF